MRMPTRDIVASCAIAAAVVLYLLWLSDVALLGMDSIRVTGLVIVVLGLVAALSAAEPGRTRLLHGNRAYLAVTSLLGLGVLAAATGILWTASSAALAVLIGVLVLLCVIATTHHILLAGTEVCPACGASEPETSCDVCGYDVVRQARGEVALDAMERRPV